MTTAVRSVDPSVSREPIALDAVNAPTVCVLCSHNCGLRVDVADGRIVDVRADESNPITHGYVCNKGFEIGHYVEHAQRLTHPLRRRPDGTFERIDWDTAIGEIAAKLRKIRDEHAPRAIGLVGIGGQGNHMDAPFGISWLQAVGSPCWYNAFAQEKHQHALIDHWLFDAAPTTFFHPDLDGTRCALVMGTNPKISNRGHAATDTFKALQKDPNCTLIVVDPRETETTRGADRHVRLRPGTDAYFLLALAAIIASSEGLADAEFLATHTSGFEELRAALATVDVDRLAERAGLSRAEIEAVAREVATADSTAIMFDLAVEHAPFSTLISYLIRVVSVLTGNVGKRGGNVFIESAVPPHRNPRRFDEPARALASGIQAIPALGGFPMFSPTLVPEEILVDHPERLRALVVEGSNPFLSYSDTSRWREARAKLDLLVVIEPAMTETAREADYVLPAPVGYEKWEQAVFPKAWPEVFVQLRPPVVPPPGEALPEPEIYTRLAEAMGLAAEPPATLHEFAKNALTPDGAMAFLGELMSSGKGGPLSVIFTAYRTLGPLLPAPSLVAVFANCHENAFQRPTSILRTLGAEWEGKNPFELASELFRRILAHPEGVEIAKADTDHQLDVNVGWEDKRIRLAPPAMLAEIARVDATELPRDPDYPFVLGGGLRTRWTANTIQRNPAWRKGRGPHCSLHLAPADATRLGVKAGDPVRVSTRRGSVELPAEPDKNVAEGHVWIPNGFGMKYPNASGELEAVGVNINELSDAAERDPISGCPQHKYTLCRVEKAA